MRLPSFTGSMLLSGAALAANGPAAVAKPGSGATQITIYNGGFATVKETRTFDLKKGENEVRMTDVTSAVETDSVVLRDVKRADAIRVLEQNYEGNPLSEARLLQQAEGKVLDFEYSSPQTGERFVIKGKVIRASSGGGGGYDQYGRYQQNNMDAIVEANGKLMFGLPGKPRFDLLDPNAILKPTLLWNLVSEQAGPRDVEVSYLTGGFKWQASYNLVAEEKGDNFDLVGWVTLENHSGKDLADAHVKLVAGDVARAQEQRGYASGGGRTNIAVFDRSVAEHTFEEYHLYTLPRPTNVMDREVKQVEFVRASNVPVRRVYVADAKTAAYRQYMPNDRSSAMQIPIATMLEIENKDSSHLGMPLPKGTIKAYRKDVDGRNEFVGEDAIGHTPKDEKLRVTIGNAFDLTAERRMMDSKMVSRDATSESYEIRLRNHKGTKVEIRVVEHLTRKPSWEITSKSAEFTKIDATTIECVVPVEANGEATVTYTVQYPIQ